ncbi:TIR domain-containing protein [[Clostridium] fimetarium]|uniref:Predicted nucleotide-binding protein containing TIR-like domain-containing protein n=1 Tax=[Clostridium] fimetarium TaxID=99656 RepID=A0A1I0QUW0_9FIRM|nr:nucleotide-binding protein [[Clostridium] fimetarium]SEW31420.1 Predicted nucleotide-binding protein containing TIR-like domain-containing protein [[Clostridium] fimetarium]
MEDMGKLQKLCDEIDDLIESCVTYDTPEFVAWKTQVTRYLSKQFGVKSPEMTIFDKRHFHPGSWTNDNQLIVACERDLKTTKLEFTTYLEEMVTEDNNYTENKSNVKTKKVLNEVFIVHGHNGELKEAIARLIEKQNIVAIILNEQANQGKTIIEKFEAHSNVGAAIAIFTADDIGKANSETDYNSRARQNVAFEAGYFMGKLNRNRVVIIAEKGLELPSDLQGVVYTDKDNWRVEVLKELKAIGFSIDFNKIFE